MERGTAAQDVPVRPTRVAERDDDGAVSSSDVKIGWPKASGLKTKRTKRDALIRQSADQTSRGRRLSSAWQIGAKNRESNLARDWFRIFERRRFETAASETAHVFSGDRQQNR